MRRIRIAQIGTSRYSHGMDIFATLKKYPDVFEIVGYAMPEGEKGEFLTGHTTFNGYTEMSVEEIMQDESIEAVVIETEEIYLTKYALMAAEHGKHIHMEKPGGISLADFEALIAAVKANGKVFHTGYMYRYSPVIRDVIRRVKEGEFGRVVSVEAQMSGWHDGEQARFLEAFPGGMMFFLGCHLIDLVLQLQGKPQAILPFNKSSGIHDTDAKDFSAAVLEYPHGVSFIKTTQAERGGFHKRRLVVTGTEGRVEICPLEVNENYPIQYAEYDECKSTEWIAWSDKKCGECYHRYGDMMLSFAAMVRGEKENPYTYDYELDLYRLIFDACKDTPTKYEEV
jgi:predicted dehydrogenase